MNIQKIREDFTILNNPKKPIIYFDNACMSLKPKHVVDKLNEYYNEYPACVGRSNHSLSERATDEYKNARSSIRKFINARSDKEIIFTRNTTEGINIVAKSLKYDVVITTDKEHNSNLVPWLKQKSEKGIRHEIINTDNGFNLKDFEHFLNRNKSNKILCSFIHTSNLDGTTIPIKEIIKIAHDHNALVMLDAAQSIPHTTIDVKKLDVDLIAFSGHKMLGPTGTGILYGRSDVLEKLNTYNVGGDTVKETFYDKYEMEETPDKFEAGLQDYAGFIGLGAAVNYLSRYIDDIEEHQIKLNAIATEALKNDIDIIGPKDAKLRSGILSFNPKNNMKYHEVSLLLDRYANIMIRSGRHCVHSWFNAHNIDGSARASFYLYNTEEEVKMFNEKLKEILKVKS
ncbi:TPA: cysteine desulfurase [Candidatus Woesearchaeota archaeon]|nr:cysteine desulfurase [Candidatus Woesearchaeota archaeon]HIH54547.1 cysteine desulfurase [Candidatus Woesearchaeota archaeon]HIJ01223.1 cysteine desulfurase [Candidatus Woesearchaeota archaeon]HIJ13512.1 cysteine desulfurase [Candidatus Woesearchaeota archaeon]